MRFGSFVVEPSAWPFSDPSLVSASNTTLYNVALRWLKEDRDARKALEAQGKKKRGARKDVWVILV